MKRVRSKKKIQRVSTIDKENKVKSKFFAFEKPNLPKSLNVKDLIKDSSNSSYSSLIHFTKNKDSEDSFSKEEFIVLVTALKELVEDEELSKEEMLLLLIHKIFGGVFADLDTLDWLEENLENASTKGKKAIQKLISVGDSFEKLLDTWEKQNPIEGFLLLIMRIIDLHTLIYWIQRTVYTTGSRSLYFRAGAMAYVRNIQRYLFKQNFQNLLSGSESLDTEDILSLIDKIPLIDRAPVDAEHMKNILRLFYSPKNVEVLQINSLRDLWNTYVKDFFFYNFEEHFSKYLRKKQDINSYIFLCFTFWDYKNDKTSGDIGSLFDSGRISSIINTIKTITEVFFAYQDKKDTNKI